VIVMGAFRFSCNFFGVSSGDAFVDKCRRAEEYGYDAVLAPDHLGAPAPFPLLVAAAAATERLRVGTLVLNVPFWNPALLAREVATTDILTGGRLEVGLGAGHMKWGSGPPLLVGGTGDRILRIAAAHADIVSVAGLYQLAGKPPGTFRLGTAVEAEERVRFARECAGQRADEIEWHLLVQMVVETRDRRGTAAELITRLGADMTVDDAVRTPFLLIGTVEEMAEQLRRTRQRYGFSYLTVHEPYMEAFAPVIQRLRS